jgi:hypothetical protein
MTIQVVALLSLPLMSAKMLNTALAFDVQSEAHASPAFQHEPARDVVDRYDS